MFLIRIGERATGETIQVINYRPSREVIKPLKAINLLTFYSL